MDSVYLLPTTYDCQKWIKLHCVHAFFKQEVKLKKKTGENECDSVHIIECIFLRNNLKRVVRGQCDKTQLYCRS